MRDVLEPTEIAGWVLRHDGYDVMTESGVESRFAIANGFLGMRASRSTNRRPSWVSWLGYIRWAAWPRCYVAGLFDVPNTEPPVPALVPVPDWSRLHVTLNGDPLSAYAGEVVQLVRRLDMRRGVLLSDWVGRAPDGLVVQGRELRLLSQADRSTGLQLVSLSLDREDVDVRIEASFALAGLDMDLDRLEPELGAFHAESSRKRLAIAGDAAMRVDGVPLVPERPFPLVWVWNWRSRAGKTIEFSRLFSVARGDTSADDPAPVAQHALSRSRALGWRAVLEAHEAAWRDRWAMCEVQIEGDEDAQRGLRFVTYHLVSAANPEDERVSVGARALTGDAYFGHVFWDTEIYLLPFYVAAWPEAARAMLMYRYHTLSAARARAARMGYRGALYAWESADTGEETTPDQVIGADGQPVEILTGKMEQHISADVALAVWRYWSATDDDVFFLDAGAEIMLETARFWASRAQPEGDGKRHIRHVIGPDEYHEDVDDNAFTNVMARWNVARALATLDILTDRWPQQATALRQKLTLTDEELVDWRDAVERLVTGFDPGSGLYEQFDGYFSLEPIDLAAHADRTQPMDVVLGRERTQASQVIKQADVVALIAVLPEAFPGDSALTNFRYYEPRCAHGSSLSPAMHAMVAARLGDTDLALRYRREIAQFDANPNAAGGVRIAGMGGIWQAVVLGFGGLDMTGDVLTVAPKLPAQWRGMSFRVSWKGRSIALQIAGRTVRATLVEGEPVEVRIGGSTQTLTAGAPLETSI